jgi:DNA ligase (NAD+)
MTDAPMSRDALDRLVSDLVAAAASYYESDYLLMTDAEYDAGIETIRSAIAADPSLSDADTDALLGSVAAGQSDGGNVVHPARMLSMAKVGAGEEGLAQIDVFIAQVEAISPAGQPAVIVEPKMDGLAVRAVYRDGTLVLAATRGDGSSGEDITYRVMRGEGITGLPTLLGDQDFTGEVRGEIYMTRDDFERANKIRVAAGGRPFVNPRNGVAGALRKSGEAAMPMHFAAYDFLGVTGGSTVPDTHQCRMDLLVAIGFETARSRIGGLGGTPRMIIDQIETVRPALPFEIDGAVIKANHDSVRAAMGEGSRTPNWAVAYKYAAEEATATVEDIEVSVGRTGRIGLRARITPTFVGGTTVTYATLHNPSWIAEQGIGIGSKVVLKRAGDVIPRITAPLDTVENAHIAPWTPPAVCPQCGGEWDKTSLLWRCTSPSCALAPALDYWASRDALDIEGLGGTVAEALAETTFTTGPLIGRRIWSVADLYDLTLDDWSSLILGTTPTGGDRTLGEANARKIMLSLADSKKQPFNRVLTGLGIRGTGRSLCRALARAFPTMDRLLEATTGDIAEVEKIGPVKAALIVDALTALGPVIDRLAARGLNMGEEPAETAGPKPLTGKTFVVSGSVPGYTRTTAQEAIEAAGGKASSSVSKTTTALITDETTTSKAKKAIALDIPIIDPTDFAALLRGDFTGLTIGRRG